MGKLTKSILVPVDFTDAATHAARNAIELGEKLKTGVHLVNFIPPVRHKAHHANTIENISEELFSSINLLKENEEKLGELVKKIDSARVEITSEIKIDKLASGIKKQLKKKDIGLIVIGIAGAHTIGDSFCNLKQAPGLIQVNCPVMVCRNHEHTFKGRHKLVVSLDFDSSEQQNVEELVFLAKKLSSKVYYIHVNHPDDKKQCSFFDIENYLNAHDLKAAAIEVVDSSDKEMAIKAYANKLSADFIAINRFSKSSGYKECHADQVVEETESPVFVY
ncbi:universal stress protein [Fulvivirga sp. 29W222]|uniref:Universal stress protein n=1 Tax=Fulvivirga marina TaxID=2494733 RepID=A0A937G1W7_9BACT|nr:universal stress protein [Fulvivirga marina]MBL6448978.1 universal stress protein [Fulvivirga marina]